MKAWVPVESITPKPGTRRGVPERFLRWFAQIGATVIKPTKYFLRTRYPTSDGKRAESAFEQAGAIAATTENVVANPTAAKSFAVPVTGDVKVDTDAQTDSAASTVLDQGNSAPTQLGEDDVQ